MWIKRVEESHFIWKDTMIVNLFVARGMSVGPNKIQATDASDCCVEKGVARAIGWTEEVTPWWGAFDVIVIPPCGSTELAGGLGYLWTYLQLFEVMGTLPTF